MTDERLTHPHLEGLIRKWRNSSQFWRENGTEYGESSAITFADCAEELEAMLATLAEKLPPLPEPVIVAELDRDDEFRHVKAYTAEQMQDYAKAALAALPGGGVEGWQPIDTAPYADFESTHPITCLVYSKRFGVQMGRAWRYTDGEACGQAIGFNGNWEVTHWMPLPSSPTPNPHEADRNG